MASKVKIRIQSEDMKLNLPAFSFSFIKALLKLSSKAAKTIMKEKLKNEIMNIEDDQKREEEIQKIMQQIEGIRMAVDILYACEAELKDTEPFTLAEVDTKKEHISVEVL